MTSSSSVVERYSICEHDYSAVELMTDPMLQFPFFVQISEVSSELHGLYDLQIIRIERSITQMRVIGEIVDGNETGEPVYVSIPLDGEQRFEYEHDDQSTVCGCHYLVTNHELPMVVNTVGDNISPVQRGEYHEPRPSITKIRLLRTFCQTYLVVNTVKDGHICMSPRLVSVLEKDLRFRHVNSIENEDERYWNYFQRHVTSLIKRYGGDNNHITGNNEIEYFHHSISDLNEVQFPKVASYVSLCSSSSVSRDCHMYDSLTAPSLTARRTKSCVVTARNHVYNSIEEVESLHHDDIHKT